MNKIEVICVSACSNERDSWCRVTIKRRGMAARHNELSWPLARRIVPRFLRRYGVREQDMGGLFAGTWVAVIR